MPISDESTPSLTPSPSRSPSPTPPVQPDHFYSPDGNAHPVPRSPESTSHSWLSPDNDPLATKGIPVFKPTMEEFEDFEAYMTRVECWGMRSGIVKIIPPKEWSDALPSVRPQLGAVRIKSPIEQHMLGRSGIFHQQNIERRKAISVREWAELCEKEDFRAPAVDEVGLKAAGAHTPHVKRRNKRRANTTTNEEDVVVKEELEDEAGLEDNTSVPELSTPIPYADIEVEAEAEADNDDASSTHTPGARKRRFPTRLEREAALAKRVELDEAFLETFDPKTAWLPRNTTASSYTPSFCSILERRYWRNCGLGKPPWYGADTAGSLFTDETASWNVSALSSTLSRLLPKSSAGLPGVNTPYLYFGMWRATFAWHVEDMDLFSINFIHFGAPKFWYAVPQMRSVQLENTLRSLFPRDGARCRQFLRHKSFLASPTLLAQSSCKPNTLVQHAGEFVVTYPRGYHAGFNLGLNCAESVNFALDSWLDIGRKAQVCGCIGDSVRIDVDALLLAREEESSEATTLASKPRSKKPKLEGDDSAKAKLPRKRKSDGTSQPKAKKQKVKLEAWEAEAGPSSSSGTKQKIMLKVPKDLGPYPCCLCVSRDTAGLLRVHDPPSAWSGCQNITPKDVSGQEVWSAHESCAMVVPETWVDDDVDDAGRVEKMVFGADAIVKDRWALKCSSCQKTRARAHGAPIQCTKGKCPKAFHISCARDGGQESRVQFTELREVEKEVIFNEMTPPVEPVDDSTMMSEATLPHDSKAIDPSVLPAPPAVATVDAVSLSRQASPQPNVIKTIKKIEYELLCTQHNPVVAAARRASKVDRVRSDLLRLTAMSRIKLRVSAGVFEVSLVSVNEERNTVEVIWDDGIKREFKWSSLVWGKTEGQAVGQKPTVAAPPHEQHTYPRLNVRFAPGYASSSATTTSDVQRTPQPAFSVGASNMQPSYASFSSGQFRYGAWSNSYYPLAASAAAAGASSMTAAGVGMPLQLSHAAQSAYSHYNYSNAFQPAASPLNWQSPTVPNRQADSAPTIPSANQRGSGSPFSQAFHKTIASSVASLPPRTGLSGTASLSGEQDHLPTASGDANLPAATGSSAGASPASVPTGDKESAKQAGPAPAATEDGKKLPPEVLQAVEELQRLSALEPEKLKEVLESRPALLEAVKILVGHQSMQTLVQAT